jgi:hypothetical protein
LLDAAEGAGKILGLDEDHPVVAILLLHYGAVVEPFVFFVDTPCDSAH